MEERVAAAISRLAGDEKRNDQTFDEYVSECLEDAVLELADEHSGDCTCIACSCPKCRAESLLGIDTIDGLGKHEASKIAGAFKDDGADSEVPIDEAIMRLRNYRPVFRADRGWTSEADFNQHVPRWIEEGQRAFAWLETYRQKHFAGPEVQP